VLTILFIAEFLLAIVSIKKCPSSEQAYITYHFSKLVSEKTSALTYEITKWLDVNINALPFG
jgi:hypothetical protein